ncbi:GDP-L-fucose synthase [Streptacidiphilus pinicola]|uniref:GDP-L-fucose synthase n=1 Tax=Streptacidiphilus pinicola TaxID=2219663 RepID=A0A2X0IKV4_9ACTN|nr:GDP-L-fucose synthase [Streptacidiphilus pinicola]RAG85744.1 GDP-L-fucose synthase [Streptacidiphilus pinicola]
MTAPPSLLAAPDPAARAGLPRSTRIFVAGAGGMVGRAICDQLRREGFSDLLRPDSRQLDLRNRQAVFDWFCTHHPEAVILTAARTGGIKAVTTRPLSLLSDNLRIQVNVLDAAAQSGVGRLLFLGSKCVYPQDAAQPIGEEALFTGALEPADSANAVAKIAGIEHVLAVRRQLGLRWITAVPCNLYGPHDNFHPEQARVVPALMRRYHRARLSGQQIVRNWGTGTPRRELLHVDDLARACLLLLERYDDPSPINVGTGEDVTIKELASMVAATVDYRGAVVWDADQPDGSPGGRLDVSRITALGWKPQVSLGEGLARTYAWFSPGFAAGTVRGS